MKYIISADHISFPTEGHISATDQCVSAGWVLQNRPRLVVTLPQLGMLKLSSCHG